LQEENLPAKDMDIVRAIVDNVGSRCGCVFTSDNITNRVFQCFPDSPETITYHALLHGDNIPQLITALQEWTDPVKSPRIPVQLLPLSVESFCMVDSTSPTEKCTSDATPVAGKPTPSSDVGSSTTITGIVGGVVVVVVVLIVTVCAGFFVVVLAVKRHNRCHDGQSNVTE
jgi:hypothetical protein